jgi:hypothetical protein
MNPSTRLRLAKEARALLPTWAAVAALMGLSALSGSDWGVFLIPLFWVGCALLGAIGVGHEFTGHTMGWLLAQPVSRRTLWAEKLLVLAGALVALLGWMLLVGVESGLRPERLGAQYRLIPIFLGLCTGPTLALVARGTIGGMIFTLVGPFMWAILAIVVFHRLRPTQFSQSRDVIFQLPVCLYAGLLWLFGYRWFRHWEDHHGHRQGVTLPPSLMRAFDVWSWRLTPRPGSVLGQLVRKELRLHRPALVLSGSFVVGWLCLVLDQVTGTVLPNDLVMLPTVLLCHGIPVLLGIVSTAEERNLGVHEWHLTLPVSARRQWLVKVGVALVLNGLLGLLLPTGLAHAASWVLQDPTLLNPSVTIFPYLPVANAALLVAALYASAAAANGLRALIGTIVIFIAGGLVLNFADYVVSTVGRFVYKTVEVGPGMWETYYFIPSFLEPVHRHRWLLGWSCLAAWLYFLGLAGFRRSLESFWQPARRMAVFFAVVCAFVFAAIVW